jgi:hypothetical protein
MSAIASQLSSAIDQAMAQTGTMVTYTPTVGSPYQILAVPENRGYLLDEGGTIIASDNQGMLVKTADMKQMPVSGDQILATVGSATTLMIVMNDGDRKNCWEYADRYQIRRRIHTKVKKTG